MSGHVRITDFLLCASDVNASLCWLRDRCKELKREMQRLEAENRELKDKVQLLEVDLAALKGQMVGYLQAVKGAQA